MSQVDTFDPKPELDRNHGKKLNTVLKDPGELMLFGGQNNTPLLRSPFKFRRYGQSGLPVSEIFPNLGESVDEICFVRSLAGESNNHVASLYLMNTGSLRQGNPSLGAWVTWALGTENPDLPGFVVLMEYATEPTGGPSNWGSGFLPAAYQGTLLRGGPTPILDLAPPAGLPAGVQRANLDLLGSLNREHGKSRADDSELEARMAAYELAYRMQAKMPEAVDLSREDPKTLEFYGANDPATASLGRKCLTARRLVERGVRFVEIYSGGYTSDDGWDAHGGLAANHARHARSADRPFAALLRDLKRTGLLSQTLVVCASEFGRMPISQGNDGRDHNPDSQTAWMAGAGVRGGHVVGATDEVGFRAVEEPHPVRDLHATILHLLGLDDHKLTYYFNGRHQRLTDNGGDVIRSALA